MPPGSAGRGTRSASIRSGHTWQRRRVAAHRRTGPGRKTAQAHALAAAGVGPAVVSSSVVGAVGAAAAVGALGGLSWRDPALRAIVFGIVCLVAPFVGFVFLVLPILGLVYSIRALTQSRFVFGIIGVVLNGLATTFTAALFFHLI